jgi:hypothetical protein
MDAVPATRYLNVSLAFGTPTQGVASITGNQITMSNNITLYFPVNLPHGATITELYSYANAGNGAVFVIALQRSPLASADMDALATTSHSGGSGSASTDSDIDYATVDNSAYKYFIYFIHSGHSSTATLYSMRIKYTVTNPLP